MTQAEAINTLKLKDEMLEFSMRKIEELQSMVSIKDRIISELIRELDAMQEGDVNAGKKSMPAMERQATADIKEIGIDDDVAQIPSFDIVHRVAKVEMTITKAIPGAKTGTGGYEAAKKSDVDQLQAPSPFREDDTKTRKTTTPASPLSPADSCSPLALKSRTSTMDSGVGDAPSSPTAPKVEVVEDLDVDTYRRSSHSERYTIKDPPRARGSSA